MEINSKEDLQAALNKVEELLEKDLTDEEDAYLDQLIDIIEAYEDIHYPIPKSPPKDVIRFLFEENDLTDNLLAEQTGLSVATIAALRIGERIATNDEAEILGKRFYVDPSIFQEDVDG